MEAGAHPPGRHAPDGSHHLPGDGDVLATIRGRLRRADERHPQGRVLRHPSDAETTWPDTRVARGDMAAEIARVKAEAGGDVIVWGGAKFAGALAAANLIDEYRLLVQPLVLGSGRPLFDQLPQRGI